jgi:hypothetical protein
MDEKCFDDSPERLVPSPSRQFGFYLVLFLLVLPLCSVIPLSWTFVLYSLYTGTVWSFSWQANVCFTLALAEVYPLFVSPSTI